MKKGAVDERFEEQRSNYEKLEKVFKQMEKNLNTFSMRLKEGYSWHFPELAKMIPDNETFVKLVALIGNKLNIKDLDINVITEITGDEQLTNKIIERT